MLLFLFLLPWQTRLIWHAGQLNGGYWEYGTFSFYGSEILLWMIIILFAVHLFWKKKFWSEITTKEHFKTHRINLLIGFAVLAFMALLIEHSLDWDVSYNFVFHILEAFCIFVILLNFENKNRLLPALWLGGVVQGLLATQQFLIQSVFASKWLGMAGQTAKDLGASVVEFGDQRWLRAYGSFGSPNSLGIYLAMLLVIGVILYINEDRPLFKIFFMVGQIFILSGLLFSFSRGAMLSAAAGILSLFLILLKKEKNKIQFFARQIFMFVLFSGFLMAIFFPVFTARLNLNNRLEQQSVSERGAQYGEAMNILNNHILLGVGPGAFTLALFRENTSLQAWQYQPVHNIYLLMLSEIGLIGAVLLFILFVQMFERIIKNNPVFIPVIVTLILAGIFDHWLWSMYTGLIFWWVIWGMGMENKQGGQPS